MLSKNGKSKRLGGINWADIALGVGMSFAFAGAVLLVISLVYQNFDGTIGSLAVISVGLAFIAVAMGAKSDARMGAMANLEFDAKLAVMLDYAEPAEKWENMYYDTRAALRLERWASKGMKSEFKRALLMVINQANADADEELITKLQDLWTAHNLDNW